jgi:hypothetical protein
MLKFTCPPQKASGANTFANNLVGLQLTQGGGLTFANFVSANPVKEKVNRDFDTGSFSGFFSLNDLNVANVEEAAKIFDTNFKIYPNFDNTNVTNFVAYGSLAKRFEASVSNIINFFPASFDANTLRSNYTTGKTIVSAVYYLGEGPGNTDITEIEIDVSILKNPFSVDYSVNAKNNISTLGFEVSKYRNFTNNFKNFVLETTGGTFSVLNAVPSTSLTAGTLTLTIQGTPFGTTIINEYLNYIVRLNDFTVNQVFNLELDEVDEILLNRFSSPLYTSTFQLPTESQNGNVFIRNQTLTWPLDGSWNIDIRTIQFTNYIEKLQTIGVDADSYITDLLERFYTTDSLKEFDTDDHKVGKTLKIYGRSFDETKKYIDSLSHTTSVNYNVKDDIASALLPNLAQTLGWKTNISPIQNNSFLSTLYESYDSEFSGMSESYPLEELQNQYYRNLILNSAYVFRSKGTRKSVEFLMKFIGAPDALVEFNENVYLADNKFPLSRFNDLYLTVVGGTYSPTVSVLDPTNTYRFFGATYTAYTTSTSVEDVSISRNDYPIDSEGYPTVPEDNDSMYFQKGAGWFESTPMHRSPEIINTSTSVFTGNNVNIQTSLEPFTYGQKYLDIFRSFPYLGEGYQLQQTNDNKKSWTDKQVGFRQNSDATYDAIYEVSDDRLVLNVKNVDLFLNPAQAISYDIWYLSNTQNYPIPITGLSSPYPQTGGTDWTFINPQPQLEDFFKFSKTFWKNMINTRNRQQSSDGKTSGYPTLQSLFWKYLTMYQDVGIENNNFSYENMMEYINSIGDYWIRLVEQVVPATTIWNTGTRFENSIFHRQKFIYRPQRGCVTVESELRGPQAVGQFPNLCRTTDVFLDLRFNENLILVSLSDLANQYECAPLQIPYIFKLKYGFTLNITKGTSNLQYTYTGTTEYVNPNIIISSPQWDQFIVDGFTSFITNLQGNGIEINDDSINTFTNPSSNKQIILESVDCQQIDITEFNLEFFDVQINCD